MNDSMDEVDNDVDDPPQDVKLYQDFKMFQSLAIPSDDEIDEYHHHQTSIQSRQWSYPKNVSVCDSNGSNKKQIIRTKHCEISMQKASKPKPSLKKSSLGIKNKKAKTVKLEQQNLIELLLLKKNTFYEHKKLRTSALAPHGKMIS